MLGLIGRKIGMTQVFSEEGVITPVTVIHVSPNVVLGTRTADKHGYDALILGAVSAKPSRVKKPKRGQFPEGIEPTRFIAEFPDYERDFGIGDKVGVEVFEEIPFVDVRGTSKGKGYQGVMKRHGFRGGAKSHGSKFHRAGGSTGQAAWPAKVMKGRKMAGRMGGVNRTAQRLEVVRISLEAGTLLVKGAVPGRRDGTVYVMKSKKA